METEFLQGAVEAARRGGAVLADWSKRFTVTEKSPANLVTEADVASQRAIHDYLVSLFPTHHFLGEENLETSTGDSEYCWMIDPLDGTTNYVHQFPYYAVSIGLTYRGEPLVGVVFDPNRNEMFTAIRGGGAYCNETRLRVSKVTALRESLVLASLPIGGGRGTPAVERFLKVLTAAQSVQRSGSAALNLCNVAAGRIDAFWSTSLLPWDCAAGVLLVTEAGGRVSRLDGGPYDVRVPDLLTSNGSGVHEELGEILRS